MSDQDLRDALGRLAADRTPTDDATDRVDAIRVRVRRRRRTRVAVMAALPVLLALAVAVAAWPSTDEAAVITDPDPTITGSSLPTEEGADDRSDPAPPTEPAGWDVPGTASLDPGPLSARMSPAVLWTERGLLVWGGRTESPNYRFEESTSFADGALYDPTTGQWTSIADAPFPSSLMSPADAVIVDGEVVAFGDGVAGIWDPGTDTWRELGPMPAHISDPVWTGESIVAVAREDYSSGTATWVAIDPSSGDVTQLPPPPLALERAEVVWTGQEVVAVGKPEGVGFPVPAEGVAYDPTAHRWRQLPRAPIQVQAPTITWNGREVLLVDHSMEAATYDPVTDAWHEIEPMPGSFSENGVTSISAGGYSLVANTMIVRTPVGAWVPLPHDPAMPLFADGIAAGSDAVIYRFGVLYEEVEPGEMRNGFQVVDLPRLAEGRSLSLGYRIDLPDDAELIEAVGEDGGRSITGRLAVGDEECVVHFRANTEVLSRAGGTVEVTPTDGTDTWTGHLSDDGTSLFHGGMEIACDNPDTTLDLARHVRWPPAPDGG